MLKSISGGGTYSHTQLTLTSIRSSQMQSLGQSSLMEYNSERDAESMSV